MKYLGKIINDKDLVTKEYVDAGLGGKANSSHTQTVSTISDLTATANELNVLDGITANTTELNYTDGVTSNIQSQLNSKQTLTNNLTAETALADGDYIPFYDTSATAHRKILWSNIKSVFKTYFDTLYSAISHTHTVSSITDLTATASELNTLDGITATVTELNYTDGVSGNIQTQLNSKLSTVGTAASATKLATARTISLTGDVTGSANFDGSANTSIISTIVGAPTKKNIANTILDYTDFVIPLCSLDNTKKSADYFAQGSIFLKRGNILSGQISQIEIICGKNYNSSDPVFSVLKSVNSNLIRPAKFTYNSILYFGLHVKITGANYTGEHYFVGNASDITLINGIYIYNNNTSTIINSEIYNSLIFLENSSLQKEIEFYKSPILRPMGDTTTYKIWNETNDGAGSGLDADKLDGNDASAFALASHTHTVANINGLQTALDNKVDDSQVLTNVPANAVFTDTVYTHPASHPPSIITQDSSNRFVTDAEKSTWNGKEPAITKNTAFNANFDTTAAHIKMNGKQSVGSLSTVARADHIHPVDTSRAAASHNHTASDITGLTATVAELNILDGITTSTAELNYSDGVTSNIQTQLNSKLPVSSYTASDVLTKLKTVDGAGSGLDADKLDGKESSAFALTSHTHTVANIDGLQTALDNKVDDSQVLTNVPAGAKFTDTVYTHPASHPPSIIAQDSSNRFVTDAEKSMWTAKEPAITKNTAFNANFDTTAAHIKMNGKQSVGSLSTVARADHVHPTDTSRAASSHTHTVSNITDLTATASEINVLDGITASTTELNYTDGVTSNIQTQLNSKLSTVGTAASATKLATARTISLTGDVTGSSSFDGSANASITTTVADNSHNHIASNISNFDTEVSNNTDVAGNTSARHTHSNKVVLDATTASYVIDEQTKLAGIEANANNYSLPVASSTALGGVKSGTDITVDASGNVSVNDDSHNHIISNVDGLQTVLDNKLQNMGKSSGSLQLGRTFYNVANFELSGTPIEIVIKTKIPYTSGLLMPYIHLHGYAYGQSAPIELKVAFYIYNGAFCNYGAVSLGSWQPTIKLFSYADGESTYVAVALVGSIYYPRFSVNMFDMWYGTTRDYSQGWTVVSTTTTPSIVGTNNLVTIPYKPTFSQAISLIGDVTGSATFNGVSGTSITATVADNSHNHTVSNITGLTASVTELNYTDGVTSNIQTQLNKKNSIIPLSATQPSSPSIGDYWYKIIT